MAIDFKKYFLFTGRATRSEFWLFTAARVFVYGFVLYALFKVILETSQSADYPSLQNHVTFLSTKRWELFLCSFVVLALIVPTYSLTSCRLHDRGYSAWSLWLVFLFFLCVVYNPIMFLLFIAVAPDVALNLARPLFGPYLGFLLEGPFRGFSWQSFVSIFASLVILFAPVFFIFTFVQSLLPSRADNKYGPNPHQ